MSFLSVMDISGSGLTAQRLRMDIIASNIANAETTRTQEGGPYVRKAPVFSIKEYTDSQNSVSLQGVKVTSIWKDPSPPQLIHNPGHPDANEDGYVKMPNVNPLLEMVDMLAAARAYEANVTAINSAKAMASKALEIARG
jgi:flagellar basal-body rod protein FlgC